MAQGTVEFVRHFYDAFNEGGIDAALEHLSPEFEWTTDPRAPEAGTYRGHAAVRRYASTLSERFEGVRFEPERFIAVGEDSALVLLHIHLHGKGSELDADFVWDALWTVRDGKGVALRTFLVREEALAAAGVDPSRTSPKLSPNGNPAT